MAEKTYAIEVDKDYSASWLKEDMTIAKSATISGDYDADSVFFKNAEGKPINYTAEKVDNDVKLSADVKVEYRLTGTVAANSKVDGFDVKAGTYEMYLAQSGDKGTSEATLNKYMFRLEPNYNGADAEEKHYVYYYFDKSDFEVKDGKVTIKNQSWNPNSDTNISLTDIKMEKIVNGVATDYASTYYTEAQKEGFNAFNYAETLSKDTTATITATIKDYATDDYEGTALFVNGTEDNLAEDLINVTMTSENYEGSWLNENITGTKNNDTINGGKGNDIITGGEGADTFVFNGAFGADLITDAFGGDIVKFSDIELANRNIEKSGDDLVILTDDGNSVTVANYFKSETRATINDINGEYKIADEVKGAEDFEKAKGGKIVVKNDDSDMDINASRYISETAKGITFTNNSKVANNTVTGSDFNDAVTLKGGNNNIVEIAGTNKITTGAGNDYVEANLYSSNTINVGAGQNTVKLDSVGANKVTAGNNDNTISVSAGSNNIKLGNGSNDVELSNGLNTVKLGNAKTTDSTLIGAYAHNDILIRDGFNKVTTGSGRDEFIIRDGNNNIKSGSGIDSFEINGGYNTINAGNGGKDATGAKKGNTITVNDGYNTITSGSYDDAFYIDGGYNVIKGGAGADTYKFTSLGEGDYSLITDSKGNDTYDFTNVTDFDGLAAITDKKGTDTIKLADNSLTLFFDGTFNKKKGFSFGKNVSLVEDIDDLNKNGIKISGKSVDKLTISCADDSKYDIDGLKSAVTAWFTSSTTAYKSVDAVLNSGNETDITSLLNVYANFDHNVDAPVA